MTNEEAIAYLKGQRACICSEDCNNLYDFYLCKQDFLCNDVEAINMAISALEKQIPKKPEYKEEDRFVKNYFAWYAYCPQCGCEIDTGNMHCTQCGQAIDWTEE